MALAAITTDCADPTAPDFPQHPTRFQAATTTAPVMLLGAGDISGCSSTGDEQTATLLDGLLSANPGATVFLAGDNAYDSGTAAEFQNCYDPTWGRFKSRTRPSLGNHEYDTGTANAYFDYFNGVGSDSGVAGKRGRGYYSFEAGQWHILMLNANNSFVGTKAGTIQETWLKADLAANTKPCIMAVWHQPLIWAGDTVIRTYVQDFWRDLYAAGADLIINGHQHYYERYAPMNPNAVADATGGIRQIIVGTGGKSVSIPSPRWPTSQVLNGNTFGVIKLTLGDGTYSWQFLPVVGKSFTDSGSGTCHGAANPPPPPPNSPPTAAFTSSCTNLACSFTDGSTDSDGTIASRSWTFGDNATGTGSGPSHTYGAGGTYNVTLTVTDNDGATNAVTHQVAVSPGNASPTAGFTQSCTDLACDFGDASTDSDGSIASWSWDFGDNSSSTIASPHHDFAQAGTYTVVLTVTDNDGGTGSKTKSLTVGTAPDQTPNAPPVAAFASSCADLSCAFTDGSSDPDGNITDRSWNFGDGGSSPAINPSHSYAAAGTYTVSLTVTDDSAATSSVSHDVTVTRPNSPPVAGFSSSCTSLSCNFIDGSTDPDGTIASRSWTFGDNTSSTATNPAHTYAAGGTYTVTLTVTDNSGASKSVSKQLTVSSSANVAPSAYFGSSCSKLACSFTDRSKDSDGTIAAWRWTFGDGTPASTLRNPSHTYNAGGTYKVVLTVTDDKGATGSISHTVTVAP